MPLRLASGPASVVAHGEATTFCGHPLVIGFELLDGSDFAVELRFRTDPADPALRVNPTAVEGRLSLACINFDAADGRGSALPVWLTLRDGTAYFLHFRVFRYGRTDDHTVHYTIYAVPEAHVPRVLAEG